MLSACNATRPRNASSPAPADVSQLYEAAKKEGKISWWTAQYSQSAAEKMRDAFTAKFPGIEVQLLRRAAQVLYQQLTDGLKAGLPVVDVFASTDESQFPPLKRQGVLAAFRPPHLGVLPKAFQELDPDEEYHLGAISFVLVNYNTRSVSSPPQTWTDFLDSKWSGKITLGHPAYSGMVGNWVLAMTDRYGWDYFQNLARNQPKINRSIIDTVTDLARAGRQVGAGPDFSTLERKAAGDPVDVQVPEDDAILIAGPVGILKNSLHPNAARLFVNFMYSREYSEALVSTYNFPLRSDVKPAGGLSLDRIKYFRNKVDRLEAGLPEAIAKWREIFGPDPAQPDH